jgi:hypothetical protein
MQREGTTAMYPPLFSASRANSTQLGHEILLMVVEAHPDVSSARNFERKPAAGQKSRDYHEIFAVNLAN